MTLGELTRIQRRLSVLARRMATEQDLGHWGKALKTADELQAFITRHKRGLLDRVAVEQSVSHR